MKFIKEIVLVALFSCICATTSFAQTDAYGYTMKTSADPDLDGFWIDLTDATRWEGVVDFAGNLDDDSFFGPLNYSFDFPYYWYTRNELYIGSNGYLSFNPVNISSPFANIPTIDSKNDFIAPFMGDMNCGGEGNPVKVLFYTDFKDTVIVSFIDLPAFNPASNGGPGNANTFQVILSRPTGQITFNYIKQQGAPNQNSSTSNYLVIGIENVSGEVGLQHSKDNAGPLSPFGSVSPTAPLTIQFTPPVTTEFKTRDLTMLWNNNPKNQVKLLTKDGKQPKHVGHLYNQGLEVGPPSAITGVLRKGVANIAGQQESQLTTSLPVGEGKSYTFNNLVLPMAEPGVYGLATNVNYDEDKIKGNNTRVSKYKIIDTTTATILLNNYDNQVNTYTGFVGAQNFSAGFGVFITPPFYPIIIKSATCAVSGAVGGTPPSGPARVQIFDDNGRNLKGEVDGSPGDKLFQADYTGAGSGVQTLNLPAPIQINSGGLWVSCLQGNTGVFIGIDNNAPVSYAHYEVINGFFVPSRSISSEEAAIGLVIELGDENAVLDLAIIDITSPAPDVDITTEQDVTIKLKNTGPAAISGPIPVSYTVNNRPEYFDTIAANVTIEPGAEYLYTFKEKTARPPAPKVRYDRICANSFLANDFVSSNNSLCTITNGVNEKMGIGAWKLYPNPAKEVLNIDLNLSKVVELTYTIVDLTGKVVKKSELANLGTGSHAISVDLNNLKTGIYTIILQSDEGFDSQRFLIME